MADPSSSTGDACAVMGPSGGTMEAILWDGQAWRVSHGPAEKNAYFSLLGVSCVGPADCTAVGLRHASGVNPSAFPYDGTPWPQQFRQTGNTGASLSAVSCWATGQCTAVGGGLGAYFDRLEAAGIGTTGAALIMTGRQGGAVTATAAPSPVAYGGSVAYSLAIRGPYVPTGSVDFMAGGVSLCAVSLDGSATCTSTSAPSGTIQVTALLVFHSGSGDDASLAGGWTTSLTVQPAPTSTTVAPSPATVTVGEPVRYSATVSSPAGTPEGAVDFTIGSVDRPLCSPAAPAVAPPPAPRPAPKPSRAPSRP